jgi:dienelactone hydrolase
MLKSAKHCCAEQQQQQGRQQQAKQQQQEAVLACDLASCRSLHRQPDRPRPVLVGFCSAAV